MKKGTCGVPGSWDVSTAVASVLHGHDKTKIGSFTGAESPVEPSAPHLQFLTIMFKKASLKIMPLANNSATTSSSNQDVRPIQCLLTAEKAVLQS